MGQKTIVGIDIGNYQTKVVIARPNPNKKDGVSIIGIGSHYSRGIQRGSIINPSETANALSQAVKEAEDSAGVRVESAYVSIGGIHTNATREVAEIKMERERKIIEEDIYDLQKEIKKRIKKINPNHTIIYQTPLNFILDNDPINQNPVGLVVRKSLRAEYFVVFCFSQHVKNIEESVDQAGITVKGILPSPIANSYSTLTDEQKDAGCVLVDIGAQSVSTLIFEDGLPISLSVFPIGSVNITNDLALHLKTSQLEAEKIKLKTADVHRENRLQNVINERIKEIFKLTEQHLKSVGKSQLLPGGIVLSGGSSGLASIEEIAKATLKLPARVINIKQKRFENRKSIPVHNSAWAVAFGLVKWANLESSHPDIQIFSILKNLTQRIFTSIRKTL